MDEPTLYSCILNKLEKDKQELLFFLDNQQEQLQRIIHELRERDIIYDLSIRKYEPTISWSQRLKNSLLNAGVHTYGDLLLGKITEEQLLKTRNFGKKCLIQLKEWFENYGLTLGRKNILTKQHHDAIIKDLIEVK